MKNVRPLAGVSGGYVYSAAVSAARPVGDYTARVIPRCDGVAIPLEAAQILWQRG
jgi:starch phosphorylase